MSDEDRNEIRDMKGGTIFRFGVESPVRSTKEIDLSCYVLGKRSTMIPDVVDRDIPYLKTRFFE